MRAGLLAAVTVLAAALPVAGTEEARHGLPVARADAARLSEVVRASGVERAVPEPEWTEYVGVVVVAGLGSLWEALRPMGSLFRVPAGFAVAAGWAFVAMVAFGTLVILARVLAGRPRVRPPAAQAREAAAAQMARATPPDAAGWLRALDLRLEAGDVAGALEALWWFLATSVASVDAQPSWTSGELLARSRRHELRPLAVQLDRFRYGPREPAPPDVRALARRFEQGLA